MNKENGISKDIYSLILKNTFGEKVRNKFIKEQVIFLELTRGKGVSNIRKTNLKTK